MAQDQKSLRLFVAAPSDVSKERIWLKEAVEEVNENHGRPLGIHVEVVEWLDVPPLQGNPQEEIYKQFPVDTWDIFVGILWGRFGQPTTSSANRIAESGTADEFYRARKSYFETGKPRVLFYRCIRKPDLEKIDPRQLGKVRHFFQDFEPDGKHPGLVQNYKNKEEFGRHLRTHLGHIVRDAADYFLPSDAKLLTPRTAVTRSSAPKNRTEKVKPPVRAESLEKPLAASENPLLHDIMEKLGRIYNGQHRRPFLHQRVVFEVTAGLWDTPGKECVIHWSLEFAPHEHPIFCLQLSLIMSPAQGGMTIPEVTVIDHHGRNLSIEYVPIQDAATPFRRSLLIYFLPELRPGEGPFIIRFREKGPLQENDLKDIKYAAERVHGAFGQILLLLHYPERVNLDFLADSKSPRGRKMTLSELEEFRPPDGYKTIGWIGRRVRLKNSGWFRVLIRKP
jgi:hypothetical protein